LAAAAFVDERIAGEGKVAERRLDALLSLFSGYKLFRPLGCKILDLLEFQDGSLAPSDDCHPLALVGRQDHHSRYCGA
jgi:hypothetical protein